MRVTFKTEGGVAHFPGLARPVRIDTTDLSPDEARELEEGVRSSRLLQTAAEEHNAGAPSDPEVRDGRCHTITVEEGGKFRTARVCDPVEDPELGSLIALLERHRRSILAAPRG